MSNMEDEIKPELTELTKQNSPGIDQKTTLKEIIDNQIDSEIEVKKKFNKTKHSSFMALCIRYMKIYKGLSTVIILMAMFASAFTAITPKLSQQLMYAILFEVNEVSNSAYWGLSWQNIVFILVGQIIAIGIFTWLMQYSAGIFGKKLSIDLRRKAMEKLIELDMSYYSDKKVGEVLTKIIADTEILSDQTAIVPATFINAIFTLTATIIVSFTIDWKLTLVAVGVYVFILAIMAISFIPLNKRLYKVRKTITSINGDVMDRINTVKLIKSSGTESYETKYFTNIHKKYYKQQEKMSLHQSILISILIVGITTTQTIVIVASSLIYSGDPEFGVLTVTFLSSVAVMTSPIMQMIRVLVGVMQASTASKRMYELLTTESRFDNHFKTHEGYKVEKIEGSIKFKNVEFAYPEKSEKVILPKFNFEFEEGKSYAFVGETGAGKSTISKLLLRFYDPTKGAVLINGNNDLKDVYLSSYLQHVGYVEQEPSIILGNIFDNVKYGAKKGATDDEVIEACKKAELHKLIMSWPDKYKTILGERGFMLSGGQKQRLVIARMFLKDPQLLILDEATSALDNIVEKEIQVKLDELMKGRITVAIAHRLSTIKNFDQINVLAPGKGIVQKGTYNELKKIPGHFKKLYEAGQMD